MKHLGFGFIALLISLSAYAGKVLQCHMIDSYLEEIRKKERHGGEIVALIRALEIKNEPLTIFSQVPVGFDPARREFLSAHFGDYIEAQLGADWSDRYYWEDQPVEGNIRPTCTATVHKGYVVQITPAKREGTLAALERRFRPMNSRFPLEIKIAKRETLHWSTWSYGNNSEGNPQDPKEIVLEKINEALLTEEGLVINREDLGKIHLFDDGNLQLRCDIVDEFTGEPI